MTLGEIKNTETLALSTEQDGTQLPHHGRHGMLVAHGQKIRTWVRFAWLIWFLTLAGGRLSDASGRHRGRFRFGFAV